MKRYVIRNETCISFERYKHTTKLATLQIILWLRFQYTSKRKYKVYLGKNVMSLSDFSIKVKGQTKRGWQMDKKTGTGRDAHSPLKDLTGRYIMAQK